MNDHRAASPYERPRPPRDIPHLLVPEKLKISHWNDRNELRVNNWIEPWDFASPIDVGIVNVPFSETSILPNGANAAPNALRDAWLIIGGDHAITAPAVRAYSRAHPDQQVGLIHFDAHNDVRVMDHGPTNGTPIRGILESDARVSGNNLVQVGIHGFMNASYTFGSAVLTFLAGLFLRTHDDWRGYDQSPIRD